MAFASTNAATTACDETPSAPPLSPVDLEEGTAAVTSVLQAKKTSLDANSIDGLKPTVAAVGSTAAESSIEPSAPPESIDTNEPALAATDSDINDEDDDEGSESEEEPEELRQGQVLWIRGLSRLQTQVIYYMQHL